MIDVQIQRVYESQGSNGGRRVLVDRIWPRGLTKEKVHADAWLKDVAPSTPLRKWFGHDPARWEQFKSRYFAELDHQPDAVARMLEEAAGSKLVLLYSAHDPEHNQAVALREYLLAHAGKKRSPRRRQAAKPSARSDSQRGRGASPAAKRKTTSDRPTRPESGRGPREDRSARAARR